MVVRKLKQLRRNQAGFTLLELMAAILISSVIGLGVTVANFQVLNQTSTNNNHTTANRQVMNAIHWISCDAQMAQTMILDVGDSGFPLALTWVDWDNSLHTANYSLSDGTLKRSLSIDSSLSVETRIADYINNDTNMTYCSSDNGVLMLTITSSVGEGTSLVDVTRKRQISSRPYL